MSLPKGMEWEECEATFGASYLKCRGSFTGNPIEVWHGSALELFDSTGEDVRFGVKDLAHAELIIRAIEAPETLEIREES